MSLWSTTEKPKHLTDAEKAITVGVDAAEAAANNLTAGWVQIQEYTDAQGNARRKSVTLVAMGSIPTDGDTSIVGETTGGGGGVVWTVPFTNGYDDGAYFTGSVLQLGTLYGTYTPLSTEYADLIRSLQIGDTIRIVGFITPNETYDRVITNITEAESGMEGQFQISFDGGLPYPGNGQEGTISSISLL